MEGNSLFSTFQMPSCAQCHTTETPCWREGPQGARTLCNACGIRWKRLMGRAKRPVNRSKPKAKAKAKAKARPKPKPTPPPVTPTPPPPIVESPMQKPQHSLVARTTRSTTRGTRNLFDNGGSLASKNVLTMSQNELLDCILTRLEDLESSQTRTSLRVRVLTQRLMRQKQKQLQNKTKPPSLPQNKTPSIVPENLRRVEPPKPIIGMSMDKEETPSSAPTTQGGEGENEAFLLVSMRDITQLPYDSFQPLQT